MGHAVSHAVRMSEPGSSKTHLLRVELASKDKSRHNSASIWDQMSHVSASRALKMANSAISANTIEEAKELLYEICFTALNARYVEMQEHQLIDIKTLDRLQESIKKGQVTPPPLADDDLSRRARLLTFFLIRLRCDRTSWLRCATRTRSCRTRSTSAGTMRRTSSRSNGHASGSAPPSARCGRSR